MAELMLEMQGIQKYFPGVHALDDCRFELRAGEVHALIGENGAGKSTLMKILSGVYGKDGGTVKLDGKEINVKSTLEAQQLGISIIHQEINLMQDLTVSENIYIGREPKIGPFLNRRAQDEKTNQLLDSLHLTDIRANTRVRSLTVAKQQMVEIAKALSFANTRILIMDEPTAALTESEIEDLFRFIRSLKARGVGIIYISHRMEEIFEICDTVSVFRDGHYVESKPVDGVSHEELIRLMVGRTVENVFPKVDCPIGEEVFRCENLCGKGFENISFTVHAGEILGLSGLVGSGRSETVRAIFGLDPIRSGKMFLNGKEITNKNPKDSIRKGICMVNEDRKAYGLCLFRSLRENISLPNLPAHQPRLLLNQKREKAEVSEVAKKLTVKAASMEHNAYSLSGGNQQKVVLSKWIMAAPKFLILDEPTRGVDVGAKSEIHTLMSQFAAQGMAILMISSELPEMMGMADRVLIYHEGHQNGEFLRKDIVSGKVTQDDILAKEFGR